MAESANRLRLNLEPGVKLDDRYELLCILAQGGMANVWLARVQGKHGFAKLVAVKTILPNIAEDDQFKQMFLDEARVASHIEHPNVVQINDVGDHLGISYLVMDLIEGESLQGILKACDRQGNSLPLGMALRILADACLGLDAAHELRDPAGMLLNVVHRDISPQNILVTVAGTAKVIDFGIAKARDRATGDTSAGTLKGKISFMPVEQALGREVDRRTDTWALGATLYLLLTGRPPYKGENQLATLQLVMSGAAITPLSDAVPGIIRGIVAKSLSYDPAARYQTARELGLALEDAMTRLGLVTTSVQVAELLNARIGERLLERRQFIASALAEAANRERVRNMLAPNRPDTDGSGSLQQVPHVVIPSGLGSSPSFTPRYPQDAMTAAMPLAHAHSTLAATTVESVRRPSGGRGLRIAVLVLLSIAMAGGGLFLILRQRSAGPTLAGAPPPAPAPSSIVAVDPKSDPNAMPQVDLSAAGATSSASASASPSARPPATATATPATATTAAGKVAGGPGVRPAGPFVKPPRPSGPTPGPAGPAPTKKHDDEAGF